MSDLIIKTELEKISTDQVTTSLVSNFKKAGEEAGKTVEQAISNSLNNLRNSFFKIGSLLGVGVGLNEVIKLAQIQEDAINKLNTSLALSGKFSEEASKSMQAFASELQKTSKFGDEVTLKNAALIQSIARLDTEGLKRATLAAANLSSALGIEYERASMILARASQGNVELLRRLGIQIEVGKNNAETFSRVLSELENRFGGAAQAQLNTFSGALQQAKNAFGDLLEGVGNFIIKSPTILAIINSLTSLFANLTNSIAFQGDIFAPILSGIRSFVQVVIELQTGIIGPFISSLESFISSIASFAFATLGAVANFVVSAFEPIFTIIKDVSSVIGGEKINAGIDSLIKKLKLLPVSIAETSEALQQNSIDTKISTSLSNSLLVIDEYIAQTQQRALQIAESNNQIKNNSVTAIQETAQSVTESGASIFEFFNSLSISFDGAASNMQQTAQQLRQAIQQNLARGISGGIQNIIQSISAGENAFANFGKFFLNTIGDLAIQMGQVLIGAGIGINSLNAVSGAGAIAAGAGLVALGAIIKAIAGGGKTSSPTSTGGNNFAPLEPASNIGTLSDPQNQERKEERASINLTIQGDVFDSEESGLRIAKLISQSAGKTGVVIRGAGYA